MENNVVTACFASFCMSHEFHVLCFEFGITVEKCSVDIVKEKIFSSFYNIAIVNA